MDADIKGSFDHINHEELLLLVKERISYRRIVKLIRLWLEASVMIDGQLDESNEGGLQGRGIPPFL